MRDREEKGNVNCFFILTIHIKKVRQRHMETDKQRLCERERGRERKREEGLSCLCLFTRHCPALSLNLHIVPDGK